MGKVIEKMKLTSLFDSTKKEEVEKALLSMNIRPYPEMEELKSPIFSESWLQVQTLSPDDVDSSFSNFDDLTWLKPVARENKVFLLGESHYYQIICNLRNRILFALNTFDRYHLLLVEDQYSISAFWDYYVGIADDNKAKNFYQDVMYEMVSTEENYNLLEHLRRWNRIHPDKRIHIGGYEIEHDYVAPLRHIIIPYFQSLDPTFKLDLDMITIRDLEYLLPELEKRLQRAKAEGLVGNYPFLTPQYVECVLNNLKSTYYAKRYDFSYYRQRAMVRNLTNPQFFGKFFREGKVMIHAGAYHTPTHFPYPEDGNFLREGSYLSFDFEPTKGKTYSVWIQGFAYSIGAMANIDLNDCLFQGDYYRDIVGKFQHAYKQGLVSPDGYYLFSKELDEFEKLVFKLAYDHKHLPMLITNVEWDNMIEAFKVVSKEAFNTLLNRKDTFNQYDAIILVPRSPIMHAKRKREDKIRTSDFMDER